MTLELFIIITVITFFILRGIVTFFVGMNIIYTFTERYMYYLSKCECETDEILEKARFESLYLQEVLHKSHMAIFKLSFVVNSNDWVTEEQLEYLYD